MRRGVSSVEVLLLSVGVGDGEHLTRDLGEKDRVVVMVSFRFRGQTEKNVLSVCLFGR